MPSSLEHQSGSQHLSEEDLALSRELLQAYRALLAANGGGAARPALGSVLLPVHQGTGQVFFAGPGAALDTPAGAVDLPTSRANGSAQLAHAVSGGLQEQQAAAGALRSPGGEGLPPVWADACLSPSDLYDKVGSLAATVSSALCLLWLVEVHGPWVRGSA
jgi:hypothetical protein